MKVTGKVVALCGALSFAASLGVLHYYGSLTLWSATTRWPAILTGLAVICAGLAALSLALSDPALPVLIVAIGFYLFGQYFDISATSYSFFGAGFWVGSAAALAVAVGGLLAALGPDAQSAVDARAAGRASALQVPMSQHTQTASPPTAPPPGWYGDPTGQSSERYWSGVGWTEHVR